MLLLTFCAIPEREEVVALQGVQDGTLMELFSEGWIHLLLNYTGICLSELPRNDAHSEKENERIWVFEWIQNQEIETERFKASHQLKQSPTKTCLKGTRVSFPHFRHSKSPWGSLWLSLEAFQVPNHALPQHLWRRWNLVGEPHGNGFSTDRGMNP